MSRIYNPGNLNLAVSKCDGVVKARELSALDVAESIIHTAQEKAEQVVRTAQETYESEKERGYREGREIAEKEAFSRMLAEQVFLDRKLQELDTDLAGVVKTSVRTIFSSFDDTALCKNAVLTALQKLRNSKNIFIYLPENLLKGFLPFAEKLKSEFREFQSLELLEDAGLSSQQFIVESNTGRIEFNLGHKLDELDASIDAAITAKAGKGSHFAAEDCSE